jgi:hypothetical protein
MAVKMSGARLINEQNAQEFVETVTPPIGGNFQSQGYNVVYDKL